LHSYPAHLIHSHLISTIPLPPRVLSRRSDWDDEEDGEWEAPLIANPDYNGPWRAKRIDNPDYKGPWEHPTIPNPDYAEDTKLHARCKVNTLNLKLFQSASASFCAARAKLR
jgi:calreticulin